ncbi:hypothetical protein HYY69_03905 [Candidatus Woesearchaeota archaeon]|nr:hypothetical protein [Candidatus Woesearchaeota archaeon]
MPISRRELFGGLAALVAGAIGCKKEPEQVEYNPPTQPNSQTNVSSAGTEPDPEPVKEPRQTASQPKGEIYSLTGIVAGAFQLGDYVEITVARVNRDPQSGEFTIDHNSLPEVLIVKNETYQNSKGNKSNPYVEIQASLEEYQKDKHGSNGCRRSLLMCDEYGIRATVTPIEYHGVLAYLVLDAAMHPTGRKEDSKVTKLLRSSYSAARKAAKDLGLDKKFDQAVRKGKDLYKEYAPQVEEQVRELFK